VTKRMLFLLFCSFALTINEQLAEKKRLRDIAEHMERMRTGEGDAVRKEVLAKLATQAVEREFEPVTEDDSSKTGKKWAAMQQKEVEERALARQQERQAEIDRAKNNYLEHASDALSHAKAKEAAEREERERVRKIEETQAEISRAHGYAKEPAIVARPVEPIERVGGGGGGDAGDDGGVPDTNGIVLEYEHIKGQKVRER
jgi:hypothetical protein